MEHPITTITTSPSISKFISSHPILTLLETKCTNMTHLHQVHSQLIKSGLSDHPLAASRLLNFTLATSSNSPYYNNNLGYAIHLFSRTPYPTAFMYNSLLRSLSKSAHPRLAISLFIDMLHSSYTRPQSQTYPPLFIAYAQIGSPRGGEQLHGLVVKHGLCTDPYVHNSMIHMYATCGHLAEAYTLFGEVAGFDDLVPCNSMIVGLARKGLVDESRRLFDEMPSKNPVTWSCMIGAYTRNGKNGEALALFRQMQREGMEPNVHTLVSLLGACSSSGALQQGEWLHAYIDRNEFEPNLIVTNAIIDMYCKCGNLRKAVEVFENSKREGISTWNTMISGLAMHGKGREAIRMFSRLENCYGLSPDRVSFVSILNACSHCGLIDELQHYFSKMKRVYGIEPGIEHYGCLVDGLARAGLIQEAMGVADRMPVEADVMIWGALLSASRSVGDMVMSKQVAKRIIELDPSDSGGYVMLANGYAGGENFARSLRMRAAMKEEGVRKEVGCSLIEVNGCVHEFVSGGMLHCEAGEICMVLSGLVFNMQDQLDLQLDFFVEGFKKRPNIING